MSKFLGTLALLVAFVLVVGIAAADDDAGKKKGKKGKGRIGDPAAAFKKLDANSDGKLTKDEFLKIADKVQDANKAAKFKERLTKTFDKLSDGKDSVTLDQFKKISELRKKKKKSADSE